MALLTILIVVFVATVIGLILTGDIMAGVQMLKRKWFDEKLRGLKKSKEVWEKKR